MKRLPIGKQVFRDLIEGDFIYVDKTEDLISMINLGIPLFLSRPRRFGKSLTTYTLKELFRGSKELFKDTYAYDNWDFTHTYPVIRLDISTVVTRNMEECEITLHDVVAKVAHEYSISLKEQRIPSKALSELIMTLAETKRVVLIIDEYDAPILNALQKPILPEIKELLRDFYKVVKASEEYLRFIFITGISKFSKRGVFSSMNNLEDITLSSQYASAAGYSRDEIDNNFREHIEKCKEKHSFSEDQFWKELKHYYNGYSWNGKDFVYNPFSVLKFFREFLFYPYWMESGSPSYIVNYAENNHLSLENLKNAVVDISFMDKKDIDKTNPLSFLTQAGYLTIKSINEYGDVTLDFPNYEVEYSFNNLLIESQYRVDSDDLMGVKRAIRKAFIDNNTEEVIHQIRTVYSSIPYMHFDNNKNEHFYHTMLLMFLRACGYDLLTEDVCSQGRSDLSLFWKERVYIIELKVNGSAESALNQIIANNYAGKYANKELVHIGLKIDFDQRNVVEWAVG